MRCRRFRWRPRFYGSRWRLSSASHRIAHQLSSASVAVDRAQLRHWSGSQPVPLVQQYTRNERFVMSTSRSKITVKGFFGSVVVGAGLVAAMATLLRRTSPFRRRTQRKAGGDFGIQSPNGV